MLRCGEIKRLVMGLDRFNKTPCGFCFVEYYTHQDALDCMKYIGGTKLDERIIRTDLDPGFQEGRQYGYRVFLVCRHIYANLVQGAESQAVKSETSTVTSMTLDAEAMAALSRWSASKKRKSMEGVGRVIESSCAIELGSLLIRWPLRRPRPTLA